MAEVKIEDVVYHLDGEFKKALADTMKKFAPNVQVNIGSAFQYFQPIAACGRRLPDSCVR